jgi:hypothetical protein
VEDDRGASLVALFQCLTGVHEWGSLTSSGHMQVHLRPELIRGTPELRNGTNVDDQVDCQVQIGGAGQNRSTWPHLARLSTLPTM